MFVNKIISYKNSWELVSQNYSTELHEVLDALDDYLSEIVTKDSAVEKLRSRKQWDKVLYDRGWELRDRTYFSTEGKRVYLGRIGPTKNGVGVFVPFGPSDYLTRWLFQQTALAVKHALVKLPIMFVPVREYMQEVRDRFFLRQSFEMHLDQLELLSPLSHQFPFLIVGYSNQLTIDPPEVIEIEADSYVENDNSVVDRCIEFPPEYHQAGLDILNYFGTYIREQYPEENASVKIEQHGLNVRMVIETESGKSEIVEKALHEYQLIITGAEPPEKFANSDKLILELKNELRIAKFRLESQQDLIGLQNDRIDKLLNIVGNGLLNRNPLTIDFKPSISLTSNTQINCDVSSALGSLNELMESIPVSSKASLAFKELEGSLSSIENNTDPESVRKSPAMSKFRRLIDKISEEGNELNAALKKAESGWEIFKDLSGKYNKIAEWCGLPQVPSIFTK